MKRLCISIRRFTLAMVPVSALFAALPPLAADEAAPAANKAPAQPTGDAKPDAAVPKSDKAGTQPLKKDKKEEEAALLIELFKKEDNITNSLGMVMVWIPDGYRVAQYEVTQAHFEQVMGSNPSKFPGAQHPVENVSWNEASEYCKKLTEKELAANKMPKGYYYSLPTEQQWEVYVDEANVKDAITSHLGDRRNPENVGGLGPNKFGLYDVRGNVWEWCSSPVARGGSWRSFEDYLGIGFRWAGTPDQRYDDIGFRVVLQGAPESGKGLPTAKAQP